MAYIDTLKESKLKEHITTRSNGRVIMHVFSPFIDAEKVAMRCTACSATATWVVNPALVYGVDLEFINDFCQIHLHGSIPLLSGPSIPNETFLTASNIKEQVEKITGMMGDITVHPFGRKGVSVSQELLKWVAKQSNFNVTLQSFTSGGIVTNNRAICEQCGQFIPLSYENLTSPFLMDASGTFIQWCKEHRHDGSNRIEVPEGRKFRAR